MLTRPASALLHPLAIALGYPDAHWKAFLEELEAEVREDLPELAETWAWLVRQDLVTLQTLYVASFDFDPKTSLTLSAHLPAQVAPGPALVRCVEAVSAAGYALPGPAWADHLPTLLEYLAVAEEAPAEIASWVGTAFAQIADHLPAGHPYRPLISWVAHALPRLPAADQKPREVSLEAAEVVPFPIRYD
ncbi:MAG: molecular chaperone TorD family protein [Firmicutes bacterium]|nr:molecular chaperone TorD family protein [Bacillota bacterium]